MTPRTVTPPKSEKPNQHYVPRWWLKGFADDKGAIYALRGDVISIVGASDLMSENWLYTVFDPWWRPSDYVEDALSKMEGHGQRLFQKLHRGLPPDDEMWRELFLFLALTVS